MTRDAEAQWVQWWCCTWRWAHPDWQTRYLSGPAEDFHRYEAVARSQHSGFLRSVGIAPDQPPPPDRDVLSWLALNAQQKRDALMLVQIICFAPTMSATADAVDHEQWCRRVAKALRPGTWLSPTVVDARELLGAWLGDIYWSRLRLAWPPGELDEIAARGPRSKLDTLWQSVLWRVATPVIVPQPHSV